MKPGHRRASRPRLCPIATGLALALSTAAMATADRVPGTALRHMPALSAALAERDISRATGWRPATPAAPEDPDALLAAWQQRPRRALPSLLHDTSRGGATHTVTNCNDDGAGSFREAMITAADNDVIDLSGLSCSTITLTGGWVEVGVDNLTIVGPGAQALALVGIEHGGGILGHLGAGTLTVQALTLRDGHHHSFTSAINAMGGCVLSTGSVTLVESLVTGCTVSTSAEMAAIGGGIVAYNDVTLIGSAIANSRAVNTFVGPPTRGGAVAAGGGIYAGGHLSLIDSVISGNTAQSDTGMSLAGGVASAGLNSKYSILANNAAAAGGAIYSGRAINLASTAIVGNQGYVAAAASLIGTSSSDILISNSTVAHNVSDYGYAMYLEADTVISNSTIAHNICVDPACTSAGIVFGGSDTLTMQSSVVAENVAIATGDRLDLIAGDPELVVAGTNNLVTGSEVTLPADTLSVRPKLSQTVRFLAGTLVLVPKGNSPVLNAGANPNGYTWDQRGGEFARESGPATDIGAFEMDWSEHLFADDFGDD